VLGHHASIVALGFAFVLLGIGIGASETVTNDLIISTAPADKAGAASAVSETAYEIGAVLGTAVLGTILATAYRANVVVPDGLSGSARTAAQETLGGAVSAATDLGGTAGQALLASARAAFDSGVTVTAGVAAVLMLVAAAASVVMLKRA